MIICPYILAEGDIDVIEFVVILVVLALSAIGGVIQKKVKDKQQERRAREAGQKLRAAAPRQRPVGTMAQPAALVPPAPQVGREAAPPLGMDTEEVVRVRQEMHLQKQRRGKLEAQRRRRLGSLGPPEADVAARESRLQSIRPTAADAAQAAPTFVAGVGISLLRPGEARKAIIMREILSAPKALRQDAEMWDS
jgi:hypothetical protein